MCGVNECKFDLCEEQCVDLPFAYRCECQPPKIVDPKNPARCIMGDQCSSSNCSQFCMEKGNGHYECACGSGYILEADKHGCKLKSRLAVYDPDGVAVDELSGNLYWTSKSRNAIMMSDSENLYIKTVYRRGPGVLPYALAIDSAHRTIFWSDVGKKPSLNRMSIIDDDRGVDVVLDSSLVRPTALAVDPYARRLYWIDQSLNYLGVCNYDGANRQILGKKMGRGLYGLDVFGDFLFFSDYTKGTVERMHKLSAKNRTTVVSGISHPKGIQARFCHYSYVYFSRDFPSRSCIQKNGRGKTRTIPVRIIRHAYKYAFQRTLDVSFTSEGYQCLCRDGMRYDEGACVNLVQSAMKTREIDYATFRNFIIALLITTALVMLFFHKNRLYVMATPSAHSTSWIGGQERYPLNTVTPDGGVENPVFESNEDTPMDPDPVVVDESNG
ncbi:Low-density lipoprotein receptor repeat class B [Ancylostoma caninum]|uniref:Low-density lipoprotein receptor repeat class B n=1 Tax=Ancylostoma caninum TaxID=29170 RepID=A0A368GDN9_ANCCA|nr:Low-density lipoprotein receptor repeat class B [Ancylostoma caninum]